ncbi:helix-turn-helix domain-containing protein [Streptomyces sp. NRRL S-1824]|uniref:helix-turn-helix domain-containing protein n=1 Tax=Streptomyces sp. NRRL S-1824 TaxID=1463889 RepID=UPI00131D910E|nr:helix-turn-helix transcriptional regulator [Streptomyces sp. NRRL S-1824]
MSFTEVETMPGQRTSSESPEPQLAFAADLRELRRRTFKKPTEEALARRMECGRSTVSAILNGRRFPNWEHTAAFVEACGDDSSRWRDRWLRASRQIEEASKGLHSPLPQLPLTGGPESQGDALLAAHWYRDNREFYEAATARACQARSEIRVTYTRRYPPTQYTTRASAEYFRTILDWASEDSDDERSVRRIIGIPERGGRPDSDMFSWARQHHEESKHILNYEANVLRWAAAADGLNMALIDDSVVFLAFSGGPRQRLNGLSVEDPTFMTYFASYFDQLWAALQPLGAYLNEVEGKGADRPG